MAKMRLEKLIAGALGVSRKDAGALIRGGRVAVSGAVVDKPDAKAEATEEITVDGEAVVYREFRYIMLNKPAGVLSATEDGRDMTAVDILPEKYRRLGLFPAGRLDKDSEGLLILTNDGQYCHNVISPRKNVEKVYYIETDAPMTPENVELFRAGAPMGGGETARPAGLELLDGSSALVTVTEGKFHQVKRMAKGAGKTVTYLKRLKIGGLSLDDTLASGEFKELTDEEAMSVFDKK